MRCYVQGCPGLDATPRRVACRGHWLNVERHFDMSEAYRQRLSLERRATRAVRTTAHLWMATLWSVWMGLYVWAFGHSLGAW